MKKITAKKFRKKWLSDEWFEKKKSKTRLVSIGNLKKWISIKYYGHE